VTNAAYNAIEELLTKLDWLVGRGAFVMRAAAIFAWLGAAAATIAVFSLLGLLGWIVAIGCLIPGWVLWRYATKLTGALDVAKIRGQLDEAVATAKSRIGEAVAGIKETGTAPIRGGLSVLKTVRAVRTDLAGFGIDVSGIAEIANPASLAAAAGSLFAALGLWALAAIGALIRVVM
jgi:hypothetical protein